MRTAITEMFGIDVPILAFTHCRDVVVAVSKAGGMGVLGAAGHSDRQLEIDLDWIEAELGPDLPYGVDLIVPAKYAGADEGGLRVDDLVAMIPDEHRRFVDDILERYDVPQLPPDSGAGERPDRAALLLHPLDHVRRRRAEGVDDEARPAGERDLELRVGPVGRERRRVGAAHQTTGS